MTLSDKIFNVGANIPLTIVKFFQMKDQDLKFWLSVIGFFVIIAVYLWWWFLW